MVIGTATETIDTEPLQIRVKGELGRQIQKEFQGWWEENRVRVREREEGEGGREREKWLDECAHVKRNSPLLSGKSSAVLHERGRRAHAGTISFCGIRAADTIHPADCWEMTTKCLV